MRRIVLPKISVVIPVYNTSNLLKRCITSILSQTLYDIEIIIVNDGSTDDSLNIINQYAEDDNRIIVISQPNQGLSAARNTGILKATSEYISFVDSDDEIEYNMLQTLYDILVRDNSDMVYTRGITKNLYNQEISFTHELNLLDKKEDIFRNMLAYKLYPGAYYSIYKKSLFLEHDILFPIQKYYEDSGTTYKLCFFAEKISLCNIPLYIYYYGNSNAITSNFKRKHIKDMFFILHDTYSFLKKNNILKKYQMEFSTNYISRIKYLINCINNTNIEKDMEYENISILLIRYIIKYSKLFKDIKTLELSSSIVLAFLNKRALINVSKIKKYKEYFKEIDFCKNIISSINDLCKYKKIYLYGAGEILDRLYPEIINQDIKILGIIDRLPQDKKIGNDIYRIINLKDIDFNQEEINIVISSEAFAYEIQRIIEKYIEDNLRNKSNINIITYLNAIDSFKRSKK